MKRRIRSMVKTKKTWLGVLAAACMVVAGCDNGTVDGSQFVPPAVDVNGDWNVAEDGSFLGIMNLIVDSSNGDLGGELKTKDGSQARLYGTMYGYAATFTMAFSAENYEVKLLFADTGDIAHGAAVDNAGFSRGLTLTR
jgi:hypothetical protein